MSATSDGQTFASWVEPMASVLHEDRRQLIAFVRSADAGIWDRPSGADEWTNRHLLAHLAGGNDQVLQTVLRAVVTGERIDPALLQLDTDAENARRVEERLTRTIDELVGDLERDDEEVQDLLSRLNDEQRDLRRPGFSLSLGEFLRIVEHERHDRLHLEQITP